MRSGRQHDAPDLRMQEHLDLAQPGSGSVRGGPDFCASSIFHGLPQSHTHPHSPRLEGVPPKTSTEYNMELPPGENWEKNVDALRLVVVRLLPHPHPLSHRRLLGCFHPHESRWINHCAKNSRLLDWEEEGAKRTGCQNEMNVVNLVEHLKILLIEECTRGVAIPSSRRGW